MADEIRKAELPADQAGPSEIKKQKGTLKHYLIVTGICIVITVLMLWKDGVFTGLEATETYRYLSDAFFVAGILTVCVGLLIFVSQKGAFDAITFSVGSFFSFLRPRDERDRYRSYADYKEEKASKGVLDCSFLIIPGGVFILIGVIFTVIYTVTAA